MKKVVLNVAAFRLGKSSLAVVLLGLIVQITLIGKHLDNSIISSYMPSALDAQDYVARALVWKNDGFTESFSDAYRLPGYPFLILVMQFLIPNNPYLGVRLLQLLVVAISAGMIKTTLERYVPRWAAIFASLVYILLPIWHFVPVLLAESFTSFIVVALIFKLRSVGEIGLGRWTVINVSILIAAGVYLKPNNLILLFLVCVFLFAKLKINSIRNISTIVLAVFILLSPWVYFASHVQSGFYGLTTNSGANLYVGTGMIVAYDDSILSKSAVKWEVDPRNNPEDLIVINSDTSPVQQNSDLTKKSLEIWKKRPLQEIGYGIDKMLIAFGIKGNSMLDKILGLFNVCALISGITLLRIKKFQAWGIVLLFAFLSLALQAAIFQADRRFVIPVLFPFATICLGLTMGYFSRQPLKLNLMSFFNKAPAQRKQI
jgi:hypothetical protein